MRGRGGVALGTVVIMLAASGLILGLAEHSPAAAFTPTRFDDPPPDGCNPGDCSLREAIIAANASPGPDTIPLEPGAYTLAIPGTAEDLGLNGDLDITEGVTTITGGSAGSTVIDGGNPATGERVLHVSSAAGASLSRVTIRNGRSAFAGGGIRVEGGGSLTLTDSTVTGNATESDGGGIRVFSLGSTFTMTNVTVSGNTAEGSGGGVGISGLTTVTNLNNVTITANTADSDGTGGGDGGGVLVFSGSPNLRNTIVAGNSDNSPALLDKEPDCSATITSQGHNLVQDTTGCTGVTGPGDKTGVDPMLASLADNGGPTQTHALLAGSPALDAGSGCAATDQRGAPRTGTCDIGAYELVFCQGVPVNRVGTEGSDVLAGTGPPTASWRWQEPTG